MLCWESMAAFSVTYAHVFSVLKVFQCCSRHSLASSLCSRLWMETADSSLCILPTLCLYWSVWCHQLIICMIAIQSSLYLVRLLSAIMNYYSVGVFRNSLTSDRRWTWIPLTFPMNMSADCCWASFETYWQTGYTDITWYLTSLPDWLRCCLIATEVSTYSTRCLSVSVISSAPDGPFVMLSEDKYQFTENNFPCCIIPCMLWSKYDYILAMLSGALYKSWSCMKAFFR